MTNEKIEKINKNKQKKVDLELDLDPSVQPSPIKSKPVQHFLSFDSVQQVYLDDLLVQLNKNKSDPQSNPEH